MFIKGIRVHITLSYNTTINSKASKYETKLHTWVIWTAAFGIVLDIEFLITVFT